MKFRTVLLSLAAAGVLTAPVTAVQAQNEQFIPYPIYRVGPYAAGGTGIAGGFFDYLSLVNTNGGVNGVTITWEECEFGYNSDRGVECYERLKGKGPTGGSMIHPLSTGVTYRLIERATVDKIPIISMGYGRTDATNGKVFPYVFPLVTNYWSQNTAKIKFMGMQEGGMENLKGKKIANLYHESSYGKETIPVLNKQSEMYGFEIRHYPVPHPGLDQKATWLEIARRYKPDWVILRGWGVMNQVAVKEAVLASGFPMPIGLHRRVVVRGRRMTSFPAGDGAGRLHRRGTFHRLPACRLPGAPRTSSSTVYGGDKGKIRRGRTASGPGATITAGLVNAILSTSSRSASAQGKFMATSR